jgi:hypothetical protein
MTVAYCSPACTENVATPLPLPPLGWDQPPVEIAPVVTSITPAYARVGGPDIVATLNGSAFNGPTVATYGGIDRPTTLISGTQVKFPIAVSAEVGPRVVPVTAHTGALAAAGSVNFQIIAALGIASVAPNTAVIGAADLVATVTGAGFTATTEVLFDGVAQPTTFVSATSVRFTVQPSLELAARTAAVTVRDGAFVGAGSQPFNFTAV